jgi:RimJ/RimL family protein N-acetyltransferase
MDRQPVLTGERLALRPLTEADRAAFCEAAGDPLIWEQHPDRDRWQAEACSAWFEGALAEGGALAAIERATGDLVGSSRFQLLGEFPDAAVIGSTFLVRRLWASDANAEMKRLMVGHALGARERVIFLVGPDNLRSRRALEKIGARLTGETITADLASGPLEHLVYAIDREGFTSGPLTR